MEKGVIEIVTKKHRPFWQTVLFIFASVIFINFLITLSNYLGEKYAGVASVVILGASGVICGLLIFKGSANYRYKLSNEEISFERLIGKRTDLLLTVAIEEIEALDKYENLNADKTINHTYKFVLDREYDKFYVGEFTREDKKYRFIFKPSERLAEILLRKVSKEEVKQ